ncbi:MAG: caspase family protein [Actinobacteria bacterium]|nr:MAG: caspase family protein [Actinomycetota bacterium]
MNPTRSRRARTAGIALALIAELASLGRAGASGTKFSDAFPAQQRATVNPSDPSTNYWALLIGINDYAGSTKDNVGSYQDARDLRKYLLSIRWHSDHIVLLANRQATASMVIQSIRWLASKTNGSSVVVFHYAGHERPGHTSSDGDNERQDTGLWAADNRNVWDGALGHELGKVRAKKMWIDISSCRAGGLDDSGMIKTGRVLTYSSPQSELSYEDPVVHYTVFGWYLIIEGMKQGQGDTNGDGVVTVEEAYRYARPDVIQRTRGKQHPTIIDKLSGSLSLVPPRAPAPPPPPPPPRNCTLVICR